MTVLSSVRFVKGSNVYSGNIGSLFCSTMAGRKVCTFCAQELCRSTFYRHLIDKSVTISWEEEKP